jgi:cytochrome c-type biogenesis protein CcmH/NrfG
VQRESILFGVAGIFFGVLVGWIIGSQQASPARQTTGQQQAAAPAAQGDAPPPLDESRVAALRENAQRDPRDSRSRVQLGNLYFDAGKYDEAARWYEEALEIDPKDPNVSTDLGITYYYTNQPDRALQQFDRSLALDPKHTKTLLNIGVVRAFGKQDLEGAAKAWQQVIDVAPGSDEARAARQALDGIRNAHPGVGTGTPPKAPSGQD